MKKLLVAIVALSAISTSAFAAPEQNHQQQIDREIKAELATLRKQIARELEEEMKAGVGRVLRK